MTFTTRIRGQRHDNVSCILPHFAHDQTSLSSSWTYLVPSVLSSSLVVRESDDRLSKDRDSQHSKKLSKVHKSKFRGLDQHVRRHWYVTKEV